MTYDEHRNTVLFLSVLDTWPKFLEWHRDGGLAFAGGGAVRLGIAADAFGRSTLCLGMKPLVQADEESV